MAKNDDVTIIHQPDLKGMMKVFKGDLKPLSEESAKTRGEQSAAWKTIEKDLHCHKKAAKQLFILSGASEEERAEYLRTFLRGVIACGILPANDLVDIMGGEKAPGVAEMKTAMGVENLAASEGASVQ